MPREPLAKSDAQLVAMAKEGELALLLLRVYRSLHVHCGGDQALMRHWMEQPNHHFGEQPPRLLLPRIEGLTRVANDLEALHGGSAVSCASSIVASDWRMKILHLFADGANNGPNLIQSDLGRLRSAG